MPAAVTHSLFGLEISSDQPVPGLPIVAAGTGPQAALHLQVTWGRLPSWCADGGLDAEPWYVSPFADTTGAPVLVATRERDGAFVRLRFAEGAEFIVDAGGSAVWAQWSAPLTAADAASYLFGPVLAFVLRLRGVTCLHASAVAIGDRAVAIAGQEGSGKSTIAAALATAGHPALSDDLVALRMDGERCTVQPGVPWLRPRHHGARLVAALAPAVHFTPTPDEGHVDLDLRQPGFRHERRPLPLGAVYVLATPAGSASAPRLEPLAPADAVTMLAADAWASRLMDAAMRTQQFEALCWVASHVPLRLLRTGSSPADVAAACRLLHDDVAAGAVLSA
jgi:hypothetical protein